MTGEEIKWPELGPESHALPTRPTGRVGVDDDGFEGAGVGAAGRQYGNYAPSSTTGEGSMADLHSSYNDPYAVPPLPHLDPNQPYHDDPSGYGGHYDPYQGPVPQSFHDPANDGAGPLPTSKSPVWLMTINSCLAKALVHPLPVIMEGKAQGLITGGKAQGLTMGGKAQGPRSRMLLADIILAITTIILPVGCDEIWGQLDSYIIYFLICFYAYTFHTQSIHSS